MKKQVERNEKKKKKTPSFWSFIVFMQVLLIKTRYSMVASVEDMHLDPPPEEDWSFHTLTSFTVIAWMAK